MELRKGKARRGTVRFSHEEGWLMTCVSRGRDTTGSDALEETGKGTVGGY